MVALRVNADPQPLAAQASFDEGRGEAILRSGGGSVLARGELQEVSSARNRDRKCPAYVALRVAHEEEQVLLQVRAGVVYFALVFAAGFVLGTNRTLWVVPRLGVRTAELMEAPIMLGVSILAAWWVVRHVQVSLLRWRRLAVGCIALGLMLVAEFTLGLWIRGMTIRGYFTARDPISGAVYFMTLGAFAVIPIFAGRPRD